MSDKKYKGIKSDSVITIKVGGAFYADAKAAMLEYLHEGENSESIQVILKNIQNKTVTTSKEKVVFVLMALMAQIEMDANDQGLVSEFDAPKIEEDPQN